MVCSWVRLPLQSLDLKAGKKRLERIKNCQVYRLGLVATDRDAVLLADELLSSMRIVEQVEARHGQLRAGVED